MRLLDDLGVRVPLGGSFAVELDAWVLRLRCLALDDVRDTLEKPAVFLLNLETPLCIGKREESGRRGGALLTLGLVDAAKSACVLGWNPPRLLIKGVDLGLCLLDAFVDAHLLLVEPHLLDVALGVDWAGRRREGYHGTGLVVGAWPPGPHQRRHALARSTTQQTLLDLRHRVRVVDVCAERFMRSGVSEGWLSGALAHGGGHWAQVRLGPLRDGGYRLMRRGRGFDGLSCLHFKYKCSQSNN